MGHHRQNLSVQLMPGSGLGLHGVPADGKPYQGRHHGAASQYRCQQNGGLGIHQIRGRHRRLGIGHHMQHRILVNVLPKLWIVGIHRPHHFKCHPGG